MPASEITIPEPPLGGPVEIFLADTTGFLLEYEPGIFTAIVRPEFECSNRFAWIDHHLICRKTFPSAPPFIYSRLWW